MCGVGCAVIGCRSVFDVHCCCMRFGQTEQRCESVVICNSALCVISGDAMVIRVCDGVRRSVCDRLWYGDASDRCCVCSGVNMWVVVLVLLGYRQW